LSASFSVRKNGKPLQGKELSRVRSRLGKQYYRSRVKKNSFVEKKKYRLDTPNEKRTIQTSRNNSRLTKGSFFGEALAGVEKGMSLRAMRRKLLR